MGDNTRATMCDCTFDKLPPSTRCLRLPPHPAALPETNPCLACAWHRGSALLTLMLSRTAVKMLLLPLPTRPTMATTSPGLTSRRGMCSLKSSALLLWWLRTESSCALQATIGVDINNKAAAEAQSFLP